MMKVAQVVFGALLSAALRAFRRRPAIPDQADHIRRAVCGRRQCRRERPHPAVGDRRRARAADRHREPAGRRRAHRRRLRGARGAGRAYALRRLERADPARTADDGEAGLSVVGGVRAGEHAGICHQPAAGASFAAGQDRAGAGRLRQGQSRQAHARDQQHRQHQSFSRRAVSAAGRHQMDGSALSRQHARDRGPDRRPR